MEEIWKDIEGYEGLYQVSNLGNIKSFNAYGNGRTKLLTLTIHKRGYICITLQKNGSRNNVRVHRLVAQAFIPNPSNLPQVNHKNGIKTDNRVENLEWCTNKDNIIHAYCNGLIKRNSGGKHHGAKVINQYDLQGNFIKRWDCIKNASDELGIYYDCITRCLKGDRKQTHGFIFKYDKE